MNNDINQLVFIKRVVVNEMGFTIDNGREVHLRGDGNEPSFKPGSCYLRNNNRKRALEWRVSNK